MPSVDFGAEVSVQIVASGHEIAIPDIRDSDPLTGAQSLTTGSARGQSHPFPALGGFCAEAPVAQEPKLSARSALRVEHLNACEIGVQNCHRRIEDFLVQRLYSLDIDQLRGDVLKALGGISLRREQLFTTPQRRVGSLQRATLLLKQPLQFCYCA